MDRNAINSFFRLHFMLMLHPSYTKKIKITDPDKKTDYGYYIYSTTLPKLSYCGLSQLHETNHFVGFKEGLIYEWVWHVPKQYNNRQYLQEKDTCLEQITSGRLVF